jgi:hypothetical protein
MQGSVSTTQLLAASLTDVLHVSQYEFSPPVQRNQPHVRIQHIFTLLQRCRDPATTKQAGDQ